MNSCDFRVFLQEFGTTVHLSLPGSVSEKERLLLKLLMQGMSVTEISQYRNRSAKTISHQKKQLFEKLGIQSDIPFWRDIFNMLVGSQEGIPSFLEENVSREDFENHKKDVAALKLLEQQEKTFNQNINLINDLRRAILYRYCKRF